MTIYDPSGKVIIEAPIAKEANIKFVLMGDYYIYLPFTLPLPVEFANGSYILYKNRRFEIMSNVYPDFDKKTGGYKYALQFQGQQNHMKRFVCFWLGGPNPEAVFHDTTDLASFGRLIVANMNKALGVESWIMGSVEVDDPKTTKLVSFNGDKCWDALNTIAQTFETEWWTEENNGIITLHFGKLDFGTPEVFERGNVVSSIPAKKGDDSSCGTRFFVFGSTRNLTKEYGQAEQGGITNHVSEIRLRLPNGQQYIDAVPNLTKDEIVEQVVFFDDVYPKNTETITGIETIDRKLEDSENGDATFKAYVMVCENTPFLPSDVLPGETIKAVFTKGSLNGREFELALIKDDANHTVIDPEKWKPTDGFNKKFEIIAQTEDAGEGKPLIIPNESLHPQPGDTFVLTGVKLPQQRIEEAEQELLEVGTSYALKHSTDTNVYDCPTNPVYCTLNEKNYEAGQAVLLKGPQFGNEGRLSRIQGYEKKLYNEYITTYTVGDNTPYSRLGSIESNVKASLYTQRIGVAETGAQIYLITRYDNTAPSDTNAYSARRSLWQFANKQTADTFRGQMTFEKGVKIGDFASGLTGMGGGSIDELGRAELDSLTLRRFLEVPELRYNRVDITMGDKWAAPSAGIIEEVDTENRIITLKLEEGEIGTVKAGDICMGIFHSSDPAENATADYDDGRGNRRFSGFATCYFRVTEILDNTNYRKFKYDLRPVSSNYPAQYSPMPFMTFVGYGSFTDAQRRSSRYDTRTYQRYLRDVSDWEFTVNNIAAQFGDLSNLAVFGLQMAGYSAYLDNIYLQGMMRNLAGGFIIDSRTRSLLLASSKTGLGMAFNPEQGLTFGAVYDPQTGKFTEEYDIKGIDQTANEAKDKIDNLQVGGRNLLVDSGRYIESTGYPFAQYYISEEIPVGTTVTLTLWGEFDERITDIAAYNSSGLGAANLFRSIEMANQLKATGKGNHTFSWKIGEPGKNNRLWLFNYYNGINGDVVTTKKVYRAKLEYGNVSTDWSPAPEDVEEDIDTAKNAADNAAAGVISLKNFTDEAFADGVVSRAEAASIEKYNNAVTETKKAVDAAYLTVYENPLLWAVPKTNLREAKVAFDSAVSALLASITSAASDKVATTQEKEDVDAKYSLFNTAYSTFTTRIEEANRFIQKSINNTAEGAYQLSEELQGIVNNLTQTIIPDLQEQIDGSIISWEGDAVPTLTNYPASEWTTETERNRHKGDYYDRFFTLNGERVTERYKFSFQNNAYLWVLVADSGASQALAEAREALGLAGTKAKIFFGATAPSVPYEVNDLWFRTNGSGASMTITIYISNANKGNAEISSEQDWQLVNDSQVRLRQMSTDGVISQEEKATLRNTLTQIDEEFVSYQQDANTYAVSIVDLAAAYDALKNFMTGTVAVANNTDTTLTTEQRNKYNANFAKYYTEVSRFTNLVAYAIAEEKAAALRESLNAFKKEYEEVIPSIQGQLDQKAGTWYQDADPSLTWTTEADKKLHVGDLWYDTTNGVTYRWSSAFKWEEQAVPKEIFDRIDGKNTVHILKPAAYDERDIWITEAEFSLAGITYPQGTILVATKSNTAFDEGDWAKFDRYTGDEAANEALKKVADLNYLKEAFDKEVIVQGGVVLRQFVGVTNASGSTTVVAGLNGSDKIGKNATHGTLLIFAGTNGVQNVSKSKTRIYEDGYIFTDRLVANGGSIGNFTITNGGLEYKGEGCGYTDVRVGIDAEGLRLTGNVDGVIQPDNYDCRMIIFSASSSAQPNGMHMCNTYATCARIVYRNGHPLSSTLDYRQNVGLAISVTGSRSMSSTPSKGNIALSLEDGEVMGWRPHIRTVRATSVTLGKHDTIVHVDSSIGEININLPSSPQHAQRYEIRKLTGSNWLNIKGNGKNILDFNASSPTSSIRWSVSAEYKLTYNVELGYWIASICYT